MKNKFNLLCATFKKEENTRKQNTGAKHTWAKYPRIPLAFVVICIIKDSTVTKRFTADRYEEGGVVEKMRGPHPHPVDLDFPASLLFQLNRRFSPD
jgi:hypothetical protein